MTKVQKRIYYADKEAVYENPDLLQRGDPQGDLPLREALCDFLRPAWETIRFCVRIQKDDAVSAWKNRCPIAAFP